MSSDNQRQLIKKNSLYNKMNFPIYEQQKTVATKDIKQAVDNDYMMYYAPYYFQILHPPKKLLTYRIFHADFFN